MKKKREFDPMNPLTWDARTWRDVLPGAALCVMMFALVWLVMVVTGE